MWRAALALLFCAGAAFSETVYQITPPEGWPWKIGVVSGSLGQAPVLWETYDYSIGTLEASVRAAERFGMVTLHLRGMPEGEPERDRGVIEVTADIGPVLQTGMAGGMVGVAIYRGADRSSARLESDLVTTRPVIERLARVPDDANFVELSGRLTARLCPKGWLGKSCQDLELQIETKVQIEDGVAMRGDGM